MTHYERIPAELQLLDQWVCATAHSKAPMKPYQAPNPMASSTNSSTWGSFREACEAPYPYLGFVFADNGYVGIDIDDGFDEEGFISPLAAEIINTCRSYTEKSRSGRGFHIILKGDLPFKGKNNLRGVEIYKTARYFIMTGDTIFYNKIEENQGAIDSVISNFFADFRENHSSRNSNKIYHPEWKAPSGNRVLLRPNYPKIPDGCRNISLTSLGGMLHNQGYEPNQIYAELLHVNETACVPPLDDWEVRAIVSSVTRYKR